MERRTTHKMHLLQFLFFGGLLVGCVGAISIDVTINGNHVNSIPAGSDVTLNCSVPPGHAVDKFDWLKDNQPVADHVVTTSFQGGVWWSSLVLQDVSPVNTTAWYACRTWKNNSTNESLQRHVCVDDKVLQVKPRHLFVDAGDGPVITCTVQARCEVLSLQWLDPSGNNITDEDRIESTSKRELKLKLVNVKQKDGGTYSCRAINSAGREVKNELFYLIVREAKPAYPPSITSPFQHVTGYHGENVTLIFSTEHTPMGLSPGTWYYDGRVVRDSPKYTVHYPQFVPGTGQGSFALTVHDLVEDDSGNYTLRITTPVIPPAVGRLQLTVHRRDPPVISKDVNISCEVENPINEKPRFYWASDGKKLTPQSKYGTHWFKHHKTRSNLYTMVLTIFDYSPSDCRWYACGMNTSQGVKEKLVAPCSLDQTDPQDDESNHAPPATWLTVLLAVSFMCTAGVATACFLFKKYKKKTIYRMPKGLKFNKDLLQWDLFISYTSKDFEWISKNLLPLLEDNDISYSIHSKDFEVGKTIVDNMADSVYNCKQIVAVVSENYIKSKFCRAELDMAVCRHVTMNGSCLTIITVDDISEKKLPKNFGKKVCVDDESEWGKQLLKHLIPLVRKNISIDT